MWILSSLTYWSSLGVVAYTYAGYPALVMTLSKIRPKPVKASFFEPSVSVVLAAHNEQASIQAKLENLLSLDYPKEKLEIIVVSDGSTDETDSIVRSYSDRGVVLEQVAQASGKPTALNRGVAKANGEVILFCDARQRIDPGALKALVAAFADPEIGVVSGELTIEGDRGPGFYWKYERAIRNAEGKIGSVPGATGALYAIRKHLFRDIPKESLLDDVFTPMQIVLQGYRAIFEPKAKAFDKESSLEGEFARKARTLAGNFQLVEHLPQIINPLKSKVAFSFISHKLMRLACPFALVTLFASNVMLVLTFAPGWPLYVSTLGAQLGTYGLAINGLVRGEKAGKVSRIAHTFVVLNAAAVEGLRRYLKGEFAWTTDKTTTNASTELEELVNVRMSTAKTTH